MSCRTSCSVQRIMTLHWSIAKQIITEKVFIGGIGVGCTHHVQEDQTYEGNVFVQLEGEIFSALVLDYVYDFIERHEYYEEACGDKDYRALGDYKTLWLLDAPGEVFWLPGGTFQK